MTEMTNPDAPLSFETILSELETLVARLEAGNLPLEESLQVFERGMRLARQGGSLLEAAERKVELLLRVQDDQVEVAPFEPREDKD
jgi:exodeoxyribonuclease VII small subunit